jgi:hypothetical protein
VRTSTADGGVWRQARACGARCILAGGKIRYSSCA